MLLDEIDDLRDLAVQIGATQGLSQLFRETFVRPLVAPEDPLAVATFAGGKFAMLSHATGLAKRLGYRVSGGASVSRVLEKGRFVEAYQTIPKSRARSAACVRSVTFSFASTLVT